MSRGDMRSARIGVVAAFALLLSTAAPVRAQIVRSFTPRISANQSGDITLIGKWNCLQVDSS